MRQIFILFIRNNHQNRVLNLFKPSKYIFTIAILRINFIIVLFDTLQEIFLLSYQLI